MDDLTSELAKARRKPWLTRSTGAMLVLVLVCGGFLAGIKVQQTYGTTSSTTPTAPTGGRPQQAQNGAQGSSQAGKIKLIDGSTIYVEKADGTVITVRTNASTAVGTKTDLKSLKVGASVTVQGAGTDTVTATAITSGG